ncbi:double-strand break repair protein AddB [Fodinicurvata sp. EGI_FJ10296]|uniref:double-strand break repair protein AddB n=1 Tax=Fodinicurvata sp. EGI_FJ10296 TaxID=3231908 RepID=UPI0034522825
MTAVTDPQCRGVFTIASGRPFLDDLVAGIVARWGDAPEALADITLLLPNRRACRALREAFLRRAGEKGQHSLLLPTMSPIGDIDPDALGLAAEDLPAIAAAMDLPPAVDPMRRRLLLARLVARFDPTMSPDRSVWLADELARLLDQVATEQVSFDGLDVLVPEELAGHWQSILDFLKIVTQAWPSVLEDEGAVDAATRRNAVLAAQAAAWRQSPPATPVIIAGSTGSIPATSALMEAVAGLPAGCVVVPGLDAALDDLSWEAVDETHPQFGLHGLLSRIGVDRTAVGPWSDPPEGEPGRHDLRPGVAAARRQLASEVMRPAVTTEHWRVGAIPPTCLEGLIRIDADSPREEADVVALIMREALEEPERTAALVTPDRALARRVGAVLTRWGVSVDDSAGRPLREAPVGAFLHLVAQAAETGCAPVRLLSLLKHPLAALGMDRAAVRRMVEALEVGVLRGPSPEPGLAGLRRRVERVGDPAAREEISVLIDRLAACAEGFLDSLSVDGEMETGGARTLADQVERHLRCAEALAATADAPGAARLWRGDDGEAAAMAVRAILDNSRDHPPVADGRYAAVFDALAGETPVRPRHGTHPRLAILGPLEARLIQADVVILGGLNEGTWPGDPTVDPWMSRPMRRSFGLSAPERRIGLSAHDFVQAFCAPDVVLTRSARADGAPTVPSRWLLRLDAVLKGAGLETPQSLYHRMRARLLHESGGYRPVGDPRPRPALALRPGTVRVSEVGMWINDPYAFYARRILALEPLRALAENPGAPERGTVIHEVLATYVRHHGLTLPPDAEARLLEYGRKAFEPLTVFPSVRAFWWPRFERVARWFLGYLATMPRDRTSIAIEDKGRLSVPRPVSGPLMVTGRADRIDRTADGLVVVDYKTGTVPPKKQMVSGIAPQLPLEGVIAEAGGFDELAPGPGTGLEVADLEHWKVGGGREPGRVDGIGRDQIAAAIEAARTGIARLAADYDTDATAYLSRPRGAVRHTDDYAYLARIAEWANDRTGTEGES